MYFQQPDSILDPQILKHLKIFIKNGGKPATVVENLSLSYRGFPQMINMMCSWMRPFGISDTEIETMVVDYLKSTIVRNFDPRKADDIFTASNTAPRWLNYMIEHAEWRNLIYHLSEKHPNCLVLNFAIQQISESGKYHKEIAGVSTAATSFRVFHRVLCDALDHLVSLDIEESALAESASLQDFKKMCCNTQYTYVYAQSLLTALITSPHVEGSGAQRAKVERMRSKFIRLSEELEQHALKEGRSSETLIRKTKFLLLEFNFILKNKTVSNAAHLHEVSSALLPMLTTNATTPGDVMKLHRLYSSPNPPPVEFIQHPDVFKLFIRDLFNPLRKINLSHVPKYIYLLAYASFGISNNNAQTKQQIDEEMKPLLHALQKSISICSSKSESLNVINAISELRSHLNFGIVAAGVVDWMMVIFTSQEFSITAYNLNNTTLFIALMKQIAFLHRPLRPAVLTLVSECFDTSVELDATIVLQLKRMYLDAMIYLLKLGHVMPTLDLVSTLCNSIDLSLVRFVVSKIFESVQPPFSKECAQRLLLILQLGRTRSALKRLQDRQRKEIEMFLGYMEKRGAEEYDLTPETIEFAKNYFSTEHLL